MPEKPFNLAEYLDAALEGFRADPPDSPFQRGYHEALREVARVAGLWHLLGDDDELPDFETD